MAALASTSLAPVDEVEEEETEVVERVARLRSRGKRVPASALSNVLDCEELITSVSDPSECGEQKETNLN